MGLRDGERVAEQGKARESTTSDSPVYSNYFYSFSKLIGQSSTSSLCFLMNSLICRLVNIWFVQEQAGSQVQRKSL